MINRKNADGQGNSEQPVKKEYTYEDLLGRMADLRSLAVRPHRGEQSGCCSSYDRRSKYEEATDTYQEWGANEDGKGYLYRENGAYVVFDKQGPGVIWRAWSAMPGEGQIKIYIDDAKEPVIRMPFQDYFEKYTAGRIPANFPNLMMTLSRGKNRFIPISFQKRCKITLERNWGMYYHFTYSLFPEGTTLPSYSSAVMRDGQIPLALTDRYLASRGDYPYEWKNTDSLVEMKVRINPGERWKCREKTPGALSCLAVRTIQGENGLQELLGNLELKIFWDRQEKPSVDCRLGSFFASPHAAKPFHALPVMVGKEEAAAYWYMPYEFFELLLKNTGTRALTFKLLLVQRKEEKEWLRDSMRFCVSTAGGDGQAALCEAGLDSARFRENGDRWPDWPFLLVKGTGRFCGLNLSVEDTWDAPKEKPESWWWGEGDKKTADWWWGEGDEKFFVDGEKFPSTFGTGSEDYIGYAWAAEPPHTAFDSAYAVQNEVPADGNGVTSVSRFHICDSIPFQKEFQGFLEKYKEEHWGGELNGICRYACTAYYYLAGGKAAAAPENE